jgi:hypothetical protein
MVGCQYGSINAWYLEQPVVLFNLPGAMRLLVVEDEPDLLAGLARALRQQGYSVDTAADGEEGLYKVTFPATCSPRFATTALLITTASSSVCGWCWRVLRARLTGAGGREAQSELERAENTGDCA